MGAHNRISKQELPKGVHRHGLLELDTLAKSKRTRIWYIFIFMREKPRITAFIQRCRRTGPHAAICHPTMMKEVQDLHRSTQRPTHQKQIAA
jgi:hypothetical protein